MSGTMKLKVAMGFNQTQRNFTFTGEAPHGTLKCTFRISQLTPIPSGSVFTAEAVSVSGTGDFSHAQKDHLVIKARAKGPQMNMTLTGLLHY